MAEEPVWPEDLVDALAEVLAAALVEAIHREDAANDQGEEPRAPQNDAA